MPLVIYIASGADTHTSWTNTISRNQTRAGLRMAHAWFKQYVDYCTACVCV